MELPDCEIEQTFKVNILSHYWVRKKFIFFKFFAKVVILLSIFIFYQHYFTDYKVIFERYDKK